MFSELWLAGAWYLQFRIWGLQYDLLGSVLKCPWTSKYKGSRFRAGWFQGREVVRNFEKFRGLGLRCIVLGFRVFPALGFRV